MHGALICNKEKLIVWMSLDVSQVEGLIPKEFGADAVEVPGARSLLADLEKEGAPWAIVVRSPSEGLLFAHLKVPNKSIYPDFRYSPVGDRMA